MLAKSFITFFKLFLRAFVLFTIKKNRGLYFYVDYQDLNTIIKKQGFAFINKNTARLFYKLKMLY